MTLFFGYNNLFEIEFAFNIFFLFKPKIGDLLPNWCSFKLLLLFPKLSYWITFTKANLSFDFGLGVILLLNFNDFGLKKFELLDKLNLLARIRALFILFKLLKLQLLFNNCLLILLKLILNPMPFLAFGKSLLPFCDSLFLGLINLIEILSDIEFELVLFIKKLFGELSLSDLLKESHALLIGKLLPDIKSPSILIFLAFGYFLIKLLFDLVFFIWLYLQNGVISLFCFKWNKLV